MASGRTAGVSESHPGGAVEGGREGPFWVEKEKCIEKTHPGAQRARSLRENPLKMAGTSHSHFLLRTTPISIHLHNSYRMLPSFATRNQAQTICHLAPTESPVKRSHGDEGLEAGVGPALCFGFGHTSWACGKGLRRPLASAEGHWTESLIKTLRCIYLL